MINQVWNGTSFVYPDAKNAQTVGGKQVADFASCTHQHVRAAITDFSHKSTHAVGGADALSALDIGALPLAGGTLTGKLTLLAGVNGGVQFPNNAFGGTGDVASITLQNPTGGENTEMTFTIGNEAGDVFNFKGVNANVLKVNDQAVWNAGNFDPSSKADAGHDHTYSVNDSWFRYKGDGSTVKLYGNSRQLVLRTDGKAEYATGVGEYPFVFMYGGDAAANRLAMINDAGNLWLKPIGWMSDALASKVDRVSATRPGVTKLYRNDSDANHSVQVDWTGSYWRMRGYAGDAFHAECWVGVAGNAESVGGILPINVAETRRLTVDQINVNNGTLKAGIYTNTGDGLKDGAGNLALSGWYHLMHMDHFDNNGYNAQLAFPLDGGTAYQKNQSPYWRNSSGGTWFGWRKILSCSVDANIDGEWCQGATAPTGTSRLNYSGYLYATKIFNAAYNDYAEYFEKGEDDLEPGDILAKNPDNETNYIKSRHAYDKLVIGVYSDDFAQCLGGTGDGHDEERNASVGMAGRVRVKVIGPVEIGQFIVASDTPGVGMASEEYRPGSVIGKALENHDGVGIKRIQALIAII